MLNDMPIGMVDVGFLMVNRSTLNVLPEENTLFIVMVSTVSVLLVQGVLQLTF